MRLRETLGMAMLAIVLVVGAPPAQTQDGAKRDHDAEMAAYMKASAPGEAHKRLEALAGSWTVTSRAWMAPGQPPAESTGSAEVKAILGGRFIQEEFTGDMMGMPFAGLGLTGYDNIRKKYTTAWVDNLSSAILTLEGTYDDAAKSYSYAGQYADPMTGSTKEMRIVMRVVDRDHHVSEFLDPVDGKWVKVMELSYKRK